MLIKILNKKNKEKKHKVLIVFDNMIADLISNKNSNSVLTELIIRSRKLNISFVFFTQSYFKVPKDVRIKSKHYPSMNIANKTELQQIATNHSLDIGFNKKLYRFLVNYTTLPSFHPLRFTKTLLARTYSKL